ncbi:response regulator [Wandonia haliotis]|uniref:Response regulator n=1 Tax=Wandonia haliotis TaxID=574963 RepID=A0ABN1MPU5_9FLAO
MKKLDILLVEDSEHDIMFIEEALHDAEVINHLVSVRNGEEALNFLHKKPPYTEAKLPDLILLDINMPVMDGFETLERIKSDYETKHIPVIMLTTSSRKEDIIKAYKELSSSYIIKPYDIFELEKVASEIKEYWLKTVRLPNQDT